ncbi:AraC family transcriptional regulator [Termitidicoccus mucosus]|uniref:AraC family transcriptional regulator n=1 Tax=Termitidicoccus mucosus TaxID=1184151 RepID=A0A178IJP3_9BACT|nr:AraC family transcriptional regulator [Opitutaceae bacterium TSB47]
MISDPFSDILRLVKAEPVIAGGFTAGGSWAIRFPQPDKIKFFALVKGSCLLCIDGWKRPVRVAEGDVFLFSGERGFVLASDLDAKPVDALRLFKGGADKTARLGRKADCIQIGGHVRLDPAGGAMLADILPQLIHVRGTAPEAAAIKWLLGQLARERAGELPGGALSSALLVQMMFVQILRVYLESSASQKAAGLFRAIGDRRIAPALRLMHGDPGRVWHLGELARAASMSRTTFAMHFKSVAGEAPLSYLAGWRMRLAAKALREENPTVSMLAERFGYASESAFSNAFKRIHGISPKRYWRAARKHAEGATAAGNPAPQA